MVFSTPLCQNFERALSKIGGSGLLASGDWGSKP